tara:strand:- start:15 stop:287 length:273 start_codon:yes stop_codon:yes gene_type:complete
MVIPIRNHVLEIIKQKENFTDKELQKLLVKDGTVITESKFNKVLLDLEIMGLISVSWVTKDSQRISDEKKQVVIGEIDKYEARCRKCFQS